mmetsp:Transcript_14671/g.16778  ORF Transcript_14671/g.16778 Transcript_14671/m.16778 type:complete len:205 (-) Transcript_14671:222-836(-)|eukprot:CAMPEP_0194134860 /NCGR_PEP_ID=MMETSP0152-20130528/4920_1 /TAXON_ID=1049557 /ORGANISM="Thalassiothrix antarctica, Strain L6-D1" /LENGTH=204 /DNA_ID=CAMNT_0038830777 /DNA_START=105 /DNA_END=719 /DNA_ORIENTATION=-
MPSRPRNKKFSKSGRGNNRFHAVSAAEIEQRNQRLADLDEERAVRRQDSDEDEEEGDEEQKTENGASGESKKVETVESRKERQQREKAEAYRKRHEAGLTDEYKEDMERLEKVRKRREEVSARKLIEKADELEAEQERLDKLKLLVKKESGKKKSKNVIPKLDKITIKKMKPPVLKEALKERGLEIQGNGKALTARLLAYEESR